MIRWRAYTMEAILVVLILALVLSAPGFATLGNLLNVLRTVAMLGIIAFGMTAVIIGGEIDLSVGAGVALAGCIVAWFSGALTPHVGSVGAVCVGIAAALLAGAATGFFTGQMRARFRVPTFITTLALFTALRGVANLITGGFPLTDLPDWFSFLGAGDLFGVPFPAYVFLAVFALMQALMGFTRFGRAVYAVGGNAEAARLSGLPVKRILVTVFALAGLFAALAGLLLAGRLDSAQPQAAAGYELDAIAAVVIGGASLSGGLGKISGTFVGALVLVVIRNGLNLLNVTSFWQQVVIGLVIALAVGVDVLRRKTRNS